MSNREKVFAELKSTVSKFLRKLKDPATLSIEIPNLYEDFVDLLQHKMYTSKLSQLGIFVPTAIKEASISLDKLIKQLEEKDANTKKYVIGFAFDESRERVVLIEKDRPEWQAGKHNGVGGKIETYDESPVAAMVREFKEETGVETTAEEWNYFAVMNVEEDIMNGKPSRMYCFRTFLSTERFEQCSTQETEQVVKVSAGVTLHQMPLIDKVHYLVRLALEEHLSFTNINMNK